MRFEAIPMKHEMVTAEDAAETRSVRRGKLAKHDLQRRSSADCPQPQSTPSVSPSTHQHECLPLFIPRCVKCSWASDDLIPVQDGMSDLLQVRQHRMKSASCLSQQPYSPWPIWSHLQAQLNRTPSNICTIMHLSLAKCVYDTGLHDQPREHERE